MQLVGLFFKDITHFVFSRQCPVEGEIRWNPFQNFSPIGRRKGRAAEVTDRILAGDAHC